MKHTYSLKTILLLTVITIQMLRSTGFAQSGKDQSVVIIEEKAVYSIPEVYELMQIAIA